MHKQGETRLRNLWLRRRIGWHQQRAGQSAITLRRTIEAAFRRFRAVVVATMAASVALATAAAGGVSRRAVRLLHTTVTSATSSTPFASSTAPRVVDSR